MGKGYLNAETAALAGQPSGNAVELDRWSALGIAGDLDFSPPDSPSALQRLHGLVYRLLGGNSSGGVPSGVGAGGEIRALPLGKEAEHCLLAPVCEQLPHAFQVYQVDSDSNHRHRWAHQSSANPCNGGGTGR